MRRSLLSSLTLAILLCGCGSQLQSDFSSPSLGVAPPNSFVDPTATPTGTVTLGPGVYVAPFARIQAGVSKVEIGALSDVQDNVTVLADTGREVTVGDRVILAHGCEVIGPERG